MSHGEKMTRQQAEVYIDTLQTLGAELHPCGSYRRGKAEIGDLDIAVLTDDFESYVEHAIEALGAVKIRGGSAMAVLHVGNHQIDLYRTEQRYLGAMLLFLTGSGAHNKKMRMKALYSGKKLSQYGLFRRDTGELLASATEKEIFTRLRMKPVPPDLR
jgi:DNA polymerase (family 10)